MEEKKIRCEIVLDGDTNDLLTKLTEKYTLSKGEVLRELIRIGSENRILEANWKELIFQDGLREYAEKEKVRLNSETYLFDLRESSKEKDRQNSRALSVMNYYLKSLTDIERRDFFQREIHADRALRGEELKALPEKVGDRIRVRINGKVLFVNEMIGDFPKLEFNQDRLIHCMTGYHTKGSWCYDCEEVTSCPTLRKERIEAIWK